MSDKRFGSSAGLTIIGDAGTAFVSSEFNSGYMSGDIKLATLSDTDDTDVTGSELVTNGTFDTDTSGWTAVNATLSTSSGGMSIADNGLYSVAYQAIPTVIGKKYIMSLQVVAVSGQLTMNYGWGTVAPNGSSFYAENTTSVASPTLNKTYTVTFTAQSTTTYISVGSDAESTITVDNISVRLAEEDRSVNGNGLQVFGTVTKTPVATGADLVAYSGFSSSNYLQQPYNSDLDFGTGDFCVMGWVNFGSSNVNSQYVVDRRSAVNPSDKFTVQMVGGSGLLYCTAGGTAVTGGPNVCDGTYKFVSFVRANGIGKIYLNGSLIASNTVNGNTTNTTAHTTVGAAYNASAAVLGSLALWRISATAPTAEQIKTIYESEKHLFTEGAKCTLTGTSDAVTALAYDSDTDLLHVGSSSGRSVFSGLRRVDETATAVTTSISASNGMVVEQ